MTRLSTGTLIVTLLVGPWGGCDREPVTPPASPPSERAPDAVGPAPGTILLDAARRHG